MPNMKVGVAKGEPATLGFDVDLLLLLRVGVVVGGGVGLDLSLGLAMRVGVVEGQREFFCVVVKFGMGALVGLDAGDAWWLRVCRGAFFEADQVVSRASEGC